MTPCSLVYDHMQSPEDPMEVCLAMELIGNVIATSSNDFISVSVLPPLLYHLLMYLGGM